MHTKDDFEWYDILWIIATALLAAVMVIYSFIPPAQAWVNGHVGVLSAAEITFFWMLWFVLGHNVVTIGLATMEHWAGYANIAGLSILLAVTLFWPMISYVWTNGDPWVIVFVILGGIAGVAAIWRLAKH